MSKKKICFINPPTTDPADSQIFFPMALVTLGGVVKQMGWQAELWDFDLYFRKVGNSSEKDFRQLLHYGVDGVGTTVFGISSICSNFPMAIWIAREIKRHCKDSLIILGGAQPSSVPVEILETFDFIDAVACGEGEGTLRQLIEVDFDRHRIKEVPGLAVRDGSTIRLNPKRELVENMDDFPYPDYSLVDLREYQRFQKGQFFPNVEVGRGCPFHCTFCSTALMWEKDYRVKSPERIMGEMQVLNERYGYSYFDFIHDNFTTSRKFVLNFCDFMDRNNEGRFRWKASSRTDCIDASRLERMERAGLFGLFFGIETGSERMQKSIKKNLDFEHFEPILRRGNELGLSLTTAFILGFPEEEVDDIDQTVLRALHYKAIGTGMVFFSKLTALTGTSIYRDNLGRFSELSQISNTSPQDYGLPYIYEIIRDYPALFSSFYHVPHTRFSADFLTKATEFFQMVVQYEAKWTLLILDKLNLSPCQLFSSWDRWASERNLSYQNFRLFNANRFSAVFRSFTDLLLRAARSDDARRAEINAPAMAFS